MKNNFVECSYIYNYYFTPVKVSSDNDLKNFKEKYLEVSTMFGIVMVI